VRPPRRPCGTCCRYRSPDSGGSQRLRFRCLGRRSRKPISARMVLMNRSAFPLVCGCGLGADGLRSRRGQAVRQVSRAVGGPCLRDPPTGDPLLREPADGPRARNQRSSPFLLISQHFDEARRWRRRSRRATFARPALGGAIDDGRVLMRWPTRSKTWPAALMSTWISCPRGAPTG